jgi:hypothetical protein
LKEVIDESSVLDALKRVGSKCRFRKAKCVIPDCGKLS